MAITITLPKLGLTMNSGSVQEWNKKIGDPVKKGEPLCIVATDKLTVDVESPADGFLIAITVQEREEVSVGTPIGLIGAEGEQPDAGAAVSPGLAGLPREAEPIIIEEEAPKTAAKLTGAGASPCSPKARKLAWEKGLDLSLIEGTGPNGWILERDILNAARGVNDPEASGGARPLAAARMTGTSKRVVIIGGGPGGYVAAIRAAQLGAAVTVIEKNRLGGTCLNAGCIPTKVLLHAAELYTALKSEGPGIGIFADNLRFDWAAVGQRKNDVVNHLVGGVEGLLKSNGVTCVYGEACLAAPGMIEVTGESGRRVIEADAVILAAGSEPAIPPIPGLDPEDPDILTSDGALSLDVLPESIAIAGGGVIGLEFASVFASFGVSVAVVETLPRILPNVDAEAAAILRRSLESKGVVFYTGARLESVTRGGGALELNVAAGSGPVSLTVGKLLIATGRRPRTGGLGREAAGVRTERGRVVVNARMETELPGIYAIGDCASPIMLAHVASREGEVAAENIMGHRVIMDYKTVPSVVYTSPAVASVGLSEEAAVKAGAWAEVRVGRFPLAANGKSVLSGDAGGMVKIVSEGRYGKVLGVHIVGGPAAEMIGEGGVALRLGATLDEIVSAVRAHPTISEAVGEAALASWGRAIHLPKTTAMS